MQIPAGPDPMMRKDAPNRAAVPIPDRSPCQLCQVRPFRPRLNLKSRGVTAENALPAKPSLKEATRFTV